MEIGGPHRLSIHPHWPLIPGDRHTEGKPSYWREFSNLRRSILRQSQLCPALRYEQLADITVPPLVKSALRKEQFQLTTPISTSTVRDYRDDPLPHLISPDAVVEIYLVPSNDDEPLLGERGAYCIRVSLRRLRLRHGPELSEHPGEVVLSLPFFAHRSTHVTDRH